eukprot:1159586-Pelagomonas_calceolata.AAC.11
MDGKFEGCSPGCSSRQAFLSALGKWHAGLHGSALAPPALAAALSQSMPYYARAMSINKKVRLHKVRIGTEPLQSAMATLPSQTQRRRLWSVNRWKWKTFLKIPHNEEWQQQQQQQQQHRPINSTEQSMLDFVHFALTDFEVQEQMLGTALLEVFRFTNNVQGDFMPFGQQLKERAPGICVHSLFKECKQILSRWMGVYTYVGAVLADGLHAILRQLSIDC